MALKSHEGQPDSCILHPEIKFLSYISLLIILLFQYFSVTINNDLTRLGTIYFKHSSTSCAIFLTGLRVTRVVLGQLPGARGYLVRDPCTRMLWVKDWTMFEADAI